MTSDIYDLLKISQYEFQCRGKITVKGKGEMVTYWLIGHKPPPTVRMDDLHKFKDQMQGEH